MGILITKWGEYLLIHKGQRPGGIKQYVKIVKAFAAWLLDKYQIEDPGQVKRELVDEWLMVLFYDFGNISNRSRASKLSALRSFFGWLRDSGQVKVDPTRGIPTPKIQPKLPQKFSTEELRLLFSAPDRETNQGLRDLALLKTLYASGLRVSELVALNVGDLVENGGYIRLQIRNGKGGKGRSQTLRMNPSKTLREWLMVRKTVLDDSGAVFIRLHGEPGRLSTRSVGKILKKYAAVVGIDTADVFCHKMRSTFATDLYDSGHDHCPRCGQIIQYVGIIELAALMGHDDPKTTMGYVAISDRALKKTAIPDKRFNEIESEIR